MKKILSRKTNFNLLQSFGSQVYELGINFIRNIFLVRYIGIMAFGKYQYLVALLAIVDFGFSSMDSVIKRFFLHANEEQRGNIFWANILLKTIFYAIFLFVFYTYYAFFNSELLINQSHFLLISLAIYFFFNKFLSTYMALFQSLEKYSVVNKMDVILNSLCFFLFLIVYFLHIISIDHFLYFYLGLNFSLTISKLIFLVLKFPEVSSFRYRTLNLNLLSIVSQGLLQYHKYFTPLLMGNFSGYVINFVPSVLLGRIGDFESVSYLEIIKKIFKFLHKIVPSTVKTMIPTIVVKRNQIDFAKKWKIYVLIYIVISIIIGLMMYVFSIPIMSIYKIKYTETVGALFALYAMYLSVGAWSQSIEFLVFSSLSTYALLVNSFLRQFFVCIGYILINRNQIFCPVALSVVTVSSVLLSLIQMLYWLYRNERRLISVQFYVFSMICFQFMLMWLVHQYQFQFSFTLSDL